ncbi:isocitrate lyase/phosphoenolpyruvate mutase family protein [Mucilaginibacter sp.]|jgi:2-methylisocitrate lyase-like PEP mutase family enzyme|uniref:isocitrate lyase/PEP mutase family protein n=1 Tax=Mucilaginibacter sp. TaxID=1882438 RepID=UPI0035625BED
MKSFETFKQLHQGPTPFLLGNVWDVKSAQVFEANNYKAIGISSQALSNAFGYDDGENLPFELLLQLAKRVCKVASIPFSVDMEGGYSRTVQGILEKIDKLHDAGVVGINLEDTIPGEVRTFLPGNEFEKILSAVADHISRNNLKLFLNIRTDGFLLGLPTALSETLTRARRYETAGADGIFVPCITNKNDIKEVVEATSLPVNVMCMPNLPGFEELGELGVKRISMGPFLFNKAYENVANLAKAINNDKSFTPLFA